MGRKRVYVAYASTLLIITKGRRQKLKQGRNLMTGADAVALT